MTTRPGDAAEAAPATIFECEPPEPGQWFAIIRAERQPDGSLRVLEVRAHVPGLDDNGYMILPASGPGGDAR